MESNGIAFVRTLPSAGVVPVVIIPDEVEVPEREDILDALAAEGARSPLVQRIALWLCTRAALEKGAHLTQRETGQALLDGLAALVEYEHDPDHREEYNRAETSLVPARGAAMSPLTGKPKGKGDCEDMAVLFVAMARSLGMSSSVVWVSQPDEPASHVAASLAVDGASEWVETTIPGARIGEAPYIAAARLGPSGNDRTGRR